MRTALLSFLAAAALFTGWAAETPRPAPPFTIMRTNLPPLALNQYKGKVVALAFIYTTCPHCQRLTGVLNQVAKDYAAQGVQVLECAFNDDAVATLPGFIGRFNPQFPIGYSNRPTVLSYLQYPPDDSRLLYVPHLLFIDRAGTIRGDYPGEGPFFKDPDGNIRKELDQMLKTSPATASR